MAKYRGMFQTIRTVAAEEGMTSLWKGIVPGLHRQCLFGGLRIGLYDPVKNFYMDKMASDEDKRLGNVSMSIKIAAGLSTGAFGITIANPTDLVKVRMQVRGRSRTDVHFKDWFLSFP